MVEQSKRRWRDSICSGRFSSSTDTSDAIHGDDHGRRTRAWRRRLRSPRVLLPLLFVGAFALAACDPKGELDTAVVSADGNGITVSGWALDEETPNPIEVTVAIANGARTRVAANGERGDVGAAFPALGSRHGYTATLPAAVGEQTVCVWFHNYGKGNDVWRTCRQVTVPPREPFGVLEVASLTNNSIRLSGWAADPDAPAPTTVGLLDLTDPPIGDKLTGSRVANLARPDIVASTGVGQAGGFAFDLPISEPGQRFLCVVAMNQRGGADRFVGCSHVEVADRRPTGAVDSVQIDGDRVTLSGTASDPDGGAVQVAIGTRPVPDASDTPVRVSTTNGRWTVTVTRGDGSHRLCPTLVDNVGAAGLRGDQTLPCAWAALGDFEITSTGATSSPVAVRSANPAIADVERDAGVSTRLSDGSTLWFFGDSSSYRNDGSLRYFVAGTAAWAPAGSETLPRDAADAAGQPFLLAGPGANFPSCRAQRPKQVLWALSAVTVPEGPDRDRVIVYLANMCLGTGWDMEARSVAVGDYLYDSKNPPDGQPVQLTIRNENLFAPGERAFGTAAVHHDGHVYVYQCDPAPPNTIDYGPCRIGRVAAANAHQRNAYQYWTGGSSWSSQIGSARTLDLPRGVAAAWNYDFPVASMTVAFHPALDHYTMVYSPWPGLGGEVAVRFAETPVGPWSLPVGASFPGCDTRVGGDRLLCYAATPQPWLSTGSRLGLGVFDQASELNGLRGQYVAASVPISVRRRAN
ncbi:MAG: DUF4185 domain-containing protein [Actinobacteria bacterium]|nr:DUF4185 domain-containing protein [Actinomycetota bacterium]